MWPLKSVAGVLSFRLVHGPLVAEIDRPLSRETYARTRPAKGTLRPGAVSPTLAALRLRSGRTAASLRPRRGGGLDGDRRGAPRCRPAQTLRAPHAAAWSSAPAMPAPADGRYPSAPRLLSCQAPLTWPVRYRGHPALGRHRRLQWPSSSRPRTPSGKTSWQRRPRCPAL